MIHGTIMFVNMVVRSLHNTCADEDGILVEDLGSRRNSNYGDHVVQFGYGMRYCTGYACSWLDERL